MMRRIALFLPCWRNIECRMKKGRENEKQAAQCHASYIIDGNNFLWQGISCCQAYIDEKKIPITRMATESCRIFMIEDNIVTG